MGKPTGNLTLMCRHDIQKAHMAARVRAVPVALPTDSYDGATGRPSSGAPRLGAANKLDWIIAEP